MQQLTPNLLREIFKVNEVKSIFISDEYGGTDYRITEVTTQNIKAEPTDKRRKALFFGFDELVHLYEQRRLIAFVERQLNITSALV